MGFREEMVGYWDSEGLVAPSKGGGSDNGTLYTSTYYDILQKSGLLTEQDKIDFASKIGACIDQNGMLNRHHVGPGNNLEKVDDFYGVLGCCKALGNTDIPRKFLWALIKHLGFMDNTTSGISFNWASFLPRQPQMIAAMVAAAFPSFSNPLHLFSRLLAMPLFLIAALTIAFSCRGADPNDADSRRLCWHLIQAVKPVSFSCWLASKIWTKRLYSVYGQDGMKAVAGRYYQQNHPFISYWITE